METMKEHLLIKIEGTAVWRMQKAHEHPKDAKRNEAASQALRELYKYVESLPEDHELFGLQDLINEHYDDLPNPDDLIFRINEQINENTRMFGFQNQETPEQWVERAVIYLRETIQTPM